MAYSYNNNSGGSNNGDLMSWIVVVAALVIFWPVGLVLLSVMLPLLGVLSAVGG